jgi:hypothetical protein
VGGIIGFSQVHNGEIFVFILYPFIDGLVSKSENKILGKFKSQVIIEEFVIKQVAVFIDEMIKWEKSTYGNHIGFLTDK